jgi:hypothetical protein
MPQRRPVTTEISDRIAENIRTCRLRRGWSRAVLSTRLHDHRCAIHPEGYTMSAAVIMAIEDGVAPQHGYPARTRPVSSDDLWVFAEIFSTTIEELMQ